MLIDEENEEIQTFEIASPGKRLFVAFIDIVNCWLLSIALSVIFPKLYDHLIYMVGISMMTAYKFLAEKTGLQTFGKMIYKIEAVTLEGKKISGSNVIRRNSIWILMLLLYVIYYYYLIPEYGVAVSNYPFVYEFINLSYAFRLGLVIVVADMGFVFITPRKQALHDLFAETIVIDKP